MSAVSLTIFTVVAFSLLGAAVAWLAHEDAARARLNAPTDFAWPQTGVFDARIWAVGCCRVLLFSTGRKMHRKLQHNR